MRCKVQIGDRVKINTSRGGEGTVIEIMKNEIIKVMDAEFQIRYVVEHDLKAIEEVEDG